MTAQQQPKKKMVKVRAEGRKKIMRNSTKVVWWEKWRNYFVVCSVSFANHFVQFILSYITRTTFMASTSHWVQVLVTPFESQPFTRTLNYLDDTANAPVQSLLRANKWSCTIYSMKNFLFIVHYVSRRWLPTTVASFTRQTTIHWKCFLSRSVSLSLSESSAWRPHPISVAVVCSYFVVSQRGVAAIFNYSLEIWRLSSTIRAPFNAKKKMQILCKHKYHTNYHSFAAGNCGSFVSR